MVLFVIGVLMVAPLVWMVSTSLTEPVEAFQLPPTWLPVPFSLAELQRDGGLMPIGRMALNSLVVAAISVAGSLFTASLAAYAFSRIQFRGRNQVFLAVAQRPDGARPADDHPDLHPDARLELVDTLAALWLPALINVFAIFFLRQYFNTIPRELDEAARIDGAGHLRILFQILVPLAGPALSALAILGFESSWNNYFGPLIFLSTPGEDDAADRPGHPLRRAGRRAGRVVVFAGITMVVVPIADRVHRVPAGVHRERRLDRDSRMTAESRGWPVPDDAPGGHPDPLRRASTLLWPNLPVLLAGSGLAVLPLGLARVLAPVLGTVGTTMLGAAFLFAVAPLLRTAMVLLAGDHRGIRDLLRGIGRDLGTALPMVVPPAGAAVLTAVAVQTWTVHGQLWAVGSAAAGAAVTVIAATIMIVALPYRLHADRPPGTCRAREAWLVGLYAVTRRPVPVLGTLCAVGLFGSVLPSVSLALGFLGLGPLALLWAAAATATLDHGRALLARLPR